VNGWFRDVLILAAAFTLASLIALSTNTSLGHAFTFGQIAFAVALVYVLLRR
jgi:Na+/H+ antiporter NhaC